MSTQWKSVSDLVLWTSLEPDRLSRQRIGSMAASDRPEGVGYMIVYLCVLCMLVSHRCVSLLVRVWAGRVGTIKDPIPSSQGWAFSVLLLYM